MCIKNNGLFVYLHAHMQKQMPISNLRWVDKTSDRLSNPTRAHLCLICVLNGPMQKWGIHTTEIFLHP